MRFRLLTIPPSALVLFTVIWSSRVSFADSTLPDSRSTPRDSDLANVALLDDGGLSNKAVDDAAVLPPDWLPRLHATVKPVVAHLGDSIIVSITATHRKGVAVTLPVRLNLGPFDELGRSERRRELDSKKEPSQVEHVFEVHIAAYELGELILPAIEINALGPGGSLVPLQTEPLRIRIDSVMPNEPNPKLMDIVGPVTVKERSWLVLYAAAGILAIILVALATLLVRRRIEARQRAALPPPPPEPPEIRAYRRLEQLPLERWLAEARFKELYLELSEILREYIGDRWSFDALEMTSREINVALQGKDVDRSVRDRLRHFFSDCDLVKFAKSRPDQDTARASVEEARSVVHDTSGSGVGQEAGVVFSTGAGAKT